MLTLPYLSRCKDMLSMAWKGSLWFVLKKIKCCCTMSHDNFTKMTLLKPTIYHQMRRAIRTTTSQQRLKQTGMQINDTILLPLYKASCMNIWLSHVRYGSSNRPFFWCQHLERRTDHLLWSSTANVDLKKTKPNPTFSQLQTTKQIQFFLISKT